MKLFFGSVALVLAYLGATAAYAQTCRPSCREGYACIDGACVSACNPPCGSGETCTSGGACTLPESHEPTARGFWFVHFGAGFGAVEVYTAHDENVTALGAQLSGGVGLHHPLTRVMGVRAQATLFLGSNFGSEYDFAAFLDGTLRIGPVSHQFPWLLGFGPIVGAAAFHGTYPNANLVVVDDPTGSAESAFIGGKAETGFEFGHLGFVADAWLGIWPRDQPSGFAVFDLRTSIAF